ncbi:MAG: phosphonate C-P lyase system protein PhnL [Thermodesulfobacteriota bacterium]|nr:phosphonate C-P lyase system protein PhnL [Thermodesulfobacteriota bacterium]
MSVDAILNVENFSKHFVLHEQDKVIPSSYNVNLKVYPGRLTALIGPTGAGKSTVLNGIYRTYLASSGRILYQTAAGHEIDLARANDHQILELRKTEIGFVTQFLHILPRQKTEDVVAQPLYQRGVSKEEGRARARETLAALNLPRRLWSLSPSTFSGGEKQRVNLARGLTSKPRLLLLDEPTASLDPLTTQRVVKQIQKLKKDNIAMLAIFHQMNLVEQLADEVVELSPPPAENGDGEKI